MGRPDPIEMKPIGGSRGAGPSSSADLPPPPYRTVASGQLGAGYRRAEDAAKARVRPSEGAMDASSMFGLVAAGWFAILALPLLLFPRMLLFLSLDPTPGAPLRPEALTALEMLLCRLMGLGCVAFSMLCIFVIVPTYTPFTHPGGPGASAGVGDAGMGAPTPAMNGSPGRQPAIITFASLGAVAAVVSWNSPTSALGTLLGLGNGVIGAWGWWSVFFGTDHHKFGKYLKPNSRMKRL